ncbi:MAE_28990/MAE_18760 family HEPN-like nuclease [Paraburkholderia heleia]|uniref:MAE_28990/MAE_18760 family HEPN-like nuclease n=1 Tax=Paraburkholderia heleia TaxID=634127 RepID=UPI0012ECD1B3|nr:MAE_28990/MAE_18760 family HEPN-like nuclease [Paraburkholderia heleia]
MQGVLADLRDREYSIERLLNHIVDVGEARGKVDIIVVLKASLFIALYNNVEATMYAIAEKIHCAASPLRYDDLAPALKTKFLRYSFGKNGGTFMQDHQKIAEEESKLRSMFANFPELSEYLRRQSLFSGNVDARKVNLIGISYGIPKIHFLKSDAEKMLWVKNKRNKIAHGEQSMSDGGQGIKTLDLELASKSIGRILRHFISAVDSYLTARAYCSSP